MYSTEVAEVATFDGIEVGFDSTMTVACCLTCKRREVEIHGVELSSVLHASSVDFHLNWHVEVAKSIAASGTSDETRYFLARLLCHKEEHPKCAEYANMEA